MRNLRLLVGAFSMFLLTGCFQTDTVIRVNPDGSGTVVETMLLSRKMIAQMNAMMQGFAGEGEKKPEPVELFEPDKLKARAAGMGEGVVYLSGKKIENADFSGYRATYAFKDINLLCLNREAGDATAAAGGSAPSLPMVFHFTRGSRSTLTIEQPRQEKKEVKPAEPVEEAGAAKQEKGAVSDEEARKLVEMFMGMRMGIVLEVNGAIVETNATHREGNRITIVDFDLAKLGSSAQNLERLKGLQGASMDDAKALMKDFPGMKIDMNDRLKVVFAKARVGG